eukprot:363216-Chlamydomonas_euryale.AAC.7
MSSVISPCERSDRSRACRGGACSVGPPLCLLSAGCAMVWAGTPRLMPLPHTTCAAWCCPHISELETRWNRRHPRLGGLAVDFPQMFMRRGCRLSSTSSTGFRIQGLKLRVSSSGFRV